MAFVEGLGEWRGVDLGDAGVFGEGELEFLGSFEETTSYNLLSTTQFKKREKKQARQDQKLAKSRTKSELPGSEQPATKSKKKASKLKGVDMDVKIESEMDSGPHLKRKKKKAEKQTLKAGNLKKKKKEMTSPVVEEENATINLTSASGQCEMEDLSETDTTEIPSEIKQAKSPRQQCFNLKGVGERMGEWKDLSVPDCVLKALEDQGFMSPTPIQQLVLLPAIRDKLDILGAAETGSGKTLAFGIPIVEGLLAETNDEERSLKALILTPTRELALQIKTHISNILTYTNLKISAVVGGLSMQKQERLLRNKPNILVGTPGRLWAFLENASNCPGDYLNNLKALKYLVIDETDRMVEKGHFEELAHIMNYVKQAGANEKRQTFVFSATLTYVHPPPKRLDSIATKQLTPEEKIDSLISLTGLRKQRKVIDITQSFGTAEALTETRINCDDLKEKDAYLYYFLMRYPGRTLIFTNSIDGSRRLYALLSKLNLTAFLLHARMHQKQRLKNLENFVESGRGILLATDVAARGLDIKGIQHVVHYQVPRTAEVYVHRSGRTARAKEKGLSVMLIDPTDVSSYRRICRNLNREHDLPVFPVSSDGLKFVEERIGLATEWESLEHRIKKSASKENWFHKQAREADLEIDDDVIGQSTSTSEAEREEMRKRIKHLQMELKFLLRHSLPEENRLRSRYITHENVTHAAQKEETNALSSMEASLAEGPRKKAKVSGTSLKIKFKKRASKFKRRKK